MNMRPLWRSLLLVFVLWFALCPTLCFASETVTSQTYTYDLRNSSGVSTFTMNDTNIASGYLNVSYLLHYTDNTGYLGSDAFLVNSTYTPPFTWSTGVTLNQTHASRYSSVNKYQYEIAFEAKSGTIFDEDTTVDVSLNGLFGAYHQQYKYTNISDGGTTITGGHNTLASPFNPNTCNEIWFRLYDVTGFTDYVITDSLVVDGDTFGIDLESFDIPMDVSKFSVIFAFPPNAITFNNLPSNFTSWSNVGAFEGRLIDSTLSIDEVDKNSGLLAGIIEWLRSIRDGIVNVGNGITNVFNSILELPAKLWNLIETGLKNLFVPSETAIAEMKDKWDILLADRFGVVYESGALVIDIANSVSEASTSETITFPSVSYNFSGTDFTFGGYEVDVIPNGFEFLADILKGVLDIVCTLAFINAMRRKYDELMMR